MLARWMIVALTAALGGASAFAQGTLRIGMMAADIPLTTGQTDQGGEGMRFMGYTVYDGLINWDLSSAEKPSGLVPGLATSWKIDEADKTRWLFTLRQGVKFHDGSDFKADAVVWNLEKLLNDTAPQFDPKQAAQGRSRIPAVKSYKAIDGYTVEIRTNGPDAFLPYQIGWVMMSSPVQWEKVGKDWNKFAQAPSGTGPWKVAAFVPQTRAELVLLPLPEATTRTAALRGGQVDWIEAPSPDAVPSLEKAGFKIVSNTYPHNWTWHLSMVDGSPWKDVRVRKTANLAIDRNGLKVLLGGLMIPAKGFVVPGSQWFGNPSFDVVEWNTMINLWRAGARSDSAKAANAINFSYFIQDPFTGFIRHIDSKLVAPNGINWGYYQEPAIDALIEQARTTFTAAEQDKVLQKIHEKIVDEALFLFVTHDGAPRAMSTKVTGFVQAQNWFQDFSPITMK